VQVRVQVFGRVPLVEAGAGGAGGRHWGEGERKGGMT
jgi:hypothetical protein